VPHIEQELPTLPEHMTPSPVFSEVCVARFLVFFVMFSRSFFFIPFLLANALSVVFDMLGSLEHVEGFFGGVFCQSKAVSSSIAQG
jgi:hypothetical protein